MSFTTGPQHPCVFEGQDAAFDPLKDLESATQKVADMPEPSMAGGLTVVVSALASEC